MKINGVAVMLKKKSPKIVQINDIIQWYENDELELSPKYQRNSVWNEKAKSYLIDTILRGLPIPPIFMRQIIDVANKKTYREVIDGQQRLRAITEFIQNKFSISISHNELYGGKKYDDLDEETKEAILEYELFVEIINEKDDPIIYDMFARLNTNNYVLNRQEIRNAKYWGEFKVAAYNSAGEYRDIFYNNKIFNDKQFSRMDDVEFISILINLIIHGIETDTPTSIDKLYSNYDNKFENYTDVKYKMNATMNIVNQIFEYLNGNVYCFTSKLYFYTLFAVVLHQLFGIENFDGRREDKFSIANINDNLRELIINIIQFGNEYTINILEEDESQKTQLYKDFTKFVKLHSTRTINKNERMERISFLNQYIIGDEIG